MVIPVISAGKIVAVVVLGDETARTNEPSVLFTVSVITMNMETWKDWHNTIKVSTTHDVKINIVFFSHKTKPLGNALWQARMPSIQV